MLSHGSKDYPAFYYPGVTSFDPRVRSFHEKYYPETAKFNRGFFFYDGVETSFYWSKARHEKALIVGCAGYNTEYIINPEEVRYLNDRGHSLIWMTLGKNMDDNLDMVRHFMTGRNSPVESIFPTSLTRYAAAHSTGGQLFMKLLHEDRTRPKLASLFSGVVYVAPYFDTANASRDHDPVWNVAFQKYAGWYRRSKPHETAFGKLYMKMAARKEVFTQRTADLSMTYDEILNLQNRGRALLDTFNAKAAASIPSVFLVGTKDPFACHKTTLNMAAKMGATILIAPGAGHDPIKENPKLLDDLVGIVDTCAAAREKRLLSTQWVSVQTRREQAEDLPEYRPPLRDRARYALQSSTRLLYSAASFL